MFLDSQENRREQPEEPGPPRGDHPEARRPRPARRACARLTCML